MTSGVVRCVVFDVDDVVIDTDRAGSLAERSVVEPLSAKIGRAAAESVGAAFSRGYDILRVQLRQPAGVKTEEFARHEARIARWQRGVLEAGFELKLWSRDTLLAIALEDHGIAVSRERVTPVTDHYWHVLAEATRIHDDAAVIIDRLRARGVHVHLATNSDGFLRFDEAAGTFTYDPLHAVQRKIERLGCLAELGLGPRDVSVGDPIGKPKREFYEKVLDEVAAKLGAPVAASAVLGVGDSLTNDVLPLIGLGAPAGAWLVRKARGRPPAALEEDRRVLVVGELTSIEVLLA